jgi:hypothetical protein
MIGRGVGRYLEDDTAGPGLRVSPGLLPKFPCSTVSSETFLISREAIY